MFIINAGGAVRNMVKAWVRLDLLVAKQAESAHSMGAPSVYHLLSGHVIAVGHVKEIFIFLNLCRLGPKLKIVFVSVPDLGALK